MAAKFVVEFYESDGHKILGSDGTAIVPLGTVSGVRARMRNYRISPRASHYVMYRVSGDNFYNEKNWHKVDSGSIAKLRTAKSKRRYAKAPRAYGSR